MNERITIQVSTDGTAAAKDSITLQAEERWNSDPDLRAEFGDNLSAYVAYERANSSGRVKTYRPFGMGEKK